MLSIGMQIAKYMKVEQKKKKNLGQKLYCNNRALLRPHSVLFPSPAFSLASSAFIRSLACTTALLNSPVSSSDSLKACPILGTLSSVSRSSPSLLGVDVGALE